MTYLYRLLFYLTILVSSSLALAQESPLLARLERVCLSVSINTDDPKDLEVEKEVLALAENALREASFPFVQNTDDPLCSALTTGTMLFSAIGPNSYSGHVGPFETRLTVSMPTAYEDIPSVPVYSKGQPLTIKKVMM
jgi:hypothetical protein